MSWGWRWQRAQQRRHGRCAVGHGRGCAAPSGGPARARCTMARDSPWPCSAAAGGSRLAAHLWQRVRGEPEDGRYQHLRAHWNGNQRKIFLFFQFQALLIVLFALPFIAVARQSRHLCHGWIAGRCRGLAGQRGRRVDRRPAAGAFSRRPGQQGPHLPRRPVALLAPSQLFLRMAALVHLRVLAVGSPLWWLAWSGPLVMYVFLRWVSGIPYHRDTGTAQPRRRLPRLPAQHADAVPLVSRRRSTAMSHPPMASDRTAAGTTTHRPARPGRTRPLPDALLRLGIRRLCGQRLREELAGGLDAQAAALRRAHRRCCARARWRSTPTPPTRQHYEVPPEFFELCLGKRLKYSSCYYPRGDETLDQAEDAMLALYGERAELADGQNILELGCGWGSLTLWMAERYPNAHITAVSNSTSSASISRRSAACAGLFNVRVITQRREPAGARQRRSSTVACRSRCSSTCATTRSCSAHRTAG